MFREIFLFELRYRRGRVINYIYFLLIFIFCFVVATNPKDPLPAQVSPNAAYFIGLYTPLMSFFFIMITSAVMGVAITRDFDHNMESIMFSTPIKKIHYLLGRFAGSMVVLILINCGIWLGFMAGFYSADLVPWSVGWKGKTLLPFDLWVYLQPFLLFTVTNLFIAGSLFFMWGALTRKTIVIYTQGILLMILYQISYFFLHDMDYQSFAALIDPFGVQMVQHVTRYWTFQEQNELLLPTSGVLLYNRLLWTGIGFVALIVTCYSFSFDVVRSGWRKKLTLPAVLADQYAMLIPVAKKIFNTTTSVRQFFQLTVFYIKVISRDIPFLAIIVGALLVLVAEAVQLDTTYGAQPLPTTAYILQRFDSFNTVLLILAIYYSGELVWKERSVNFNMITDALPVKSIITLSAKFVTLLMLYILLLMLLILCGVLVQISHSYTDFDWPVYFTTVYYATFSTLILYTLLSFFIQVVVNNKFLGFSLCILFIIINASLNGLGLTNDLYQYASGTLGTFSEMNRYGHFVVPFVWFKIYWLAFAGALFGICIGACHRGAESNLSMRWKGFREQFTWGVATITTIFMLTFVGTGSYIYYNGNVLNTYQPAMVTPSLVSTTQGVNKQNTNSAASIPQATLLALDLKLELYPARRSFTLKGFGILKNLSSLPVLEISIVPASEKQMSTMRVDFSKPVTQKVGMDTARFKTYLLAAPLLPGDSIRLRFSDEFVTRGFVGKNSNTNVVYNGTFISSAYFPSLRNNDQLGNCSDHRMRLHITVGTEDGQIAIAPGTLERKWSQAGRNYYSYSGIIPTSGKYAIASARYAVKEEKWRNIDLKIYYHPAHINNLDRMIESMKGGLEYCTANFGAYKRTSLTIIEFPGYSGNALSFAGVIPFSESNEFILTRGGAQDVDQVKYNAVYGTARQWWDDQIIPAGAAGSGTLSRGMAHYSALMVMKHAYAPEVVGKYLKHTLDSYMNSHTIERKKERPLIASVDQEYVTSNKSSLVFFYLQDLIGEDSVNAAFRRYATRWSAQKACLPTAEDLVAAVILVTPDSLRQTVHELFETVTLFENKAIESSYRERSKARFEVTLSVTSEKFRNDGAGKEVSVALNDWVDVGIYKTDSKGTEKLIYLKKHKITQHTTTFTVIVKEEPSRAGIDPLNKLVDKHSGDNVVTASKVISIGDALLQ